MKKTVCLLCAFLLICGSAIALQSCAKTPDTPSVENTTAAVETPTEEVTAEVSTADPDWSYDLPVLNYENEKIRFFVEGQSFAADEFKADDLNGQLVNDAVFERNAAVESKLGVVFEFDVASSSDVYAVGNKIRTNVGGGTYYYDIVTLPSYTHTAYALEGDFCNLLHVDNLNLDKHYWTQGFNSIMSNGKRQYIASGAFSLSMIRNMYITLYNKDELESRHLPDLYTLVGTKEWTVARQMEIIKDTYSDETGNGIRDAGDFYGFVSGTNTSCDPYWVGFHMPILQVDKTTGVFSIDVDQTKMTDILLTIRNLIINNPDTWNKGSSGSDDGAYTMTAIEMFAASRCAMTTATVYGIESVLTTSEFTGNYGIVPIPMFDADQENYYTHVQDQLSVMAIVKNVPEENQPMLGAVMETLAYQSYESVFPAYYESALSYRYLQNPESKEMLDLIYNSITIEGCFIYSSSFAFLGQLRSMASNSGTSPGALVRNGLSQLNSKLKKFNEDMSKLKD